MDSVAITRSVLEGKTDKEIIEFLQQEAFKEMRYLRRVWPAKKAGRKYTLQGRVRGEVHPLQEKIKKLTKNPFF